MSSLLCCDLPLFQGVSPSAVAGFLQTGHSLVGFVLLAAALFFKYKISTKEAISVANLFEQNVVLPISSLQKEQEQIQC